MTQLLQVDVIHGAPDCPVLDPDQLKMVIDNLEGLVDEVEKLSDGKVKILADWYNRNAHEFHYLLELTDIDPVRAEDILKQALGLKKITVRSYPTESGEQALETLRKKLS